MTDLAVGTMLNDRYQLEGELGRGGMGIVYRAHDTLLDRDVAVKMVSSLNLGNEGRARLLGEAKAIAKLNHPHIVAVYDAGEIEKSPFVVMELIAGKSLHDDPPKDFETIVTVARDISRALEHAHAQGIVHRDLKPENVILLPDGTAKLMDFGIARSVTSRMTSEGNIIGTVFYLAPELALGQEFDGRADLYALGVMLYELTTGALPFAHGDPLAVISQQIHASPVPPRAKNPQIPPRLESLILQLLAKRPAERPGSAAAAISSLDDPGLLDPAAVTDRELTVLNRIARGHFVGRQRELKQARSIWIRAQQGKGQTLLISGEPGIGKSRLARELATQAEISGGKVLLGECYPEGGVPYSPFSQILRRALRWTSENGSNLPDFVLADLLTLAPDLRPYYPDVPENPTLDPESQQRRLFESVVSLCTSLSEQAPLFLAIEDAHWADSGTLSLLRHIVRRTKEQPIMVVASYREVGLDEARPLQEMLVELNRERLADRLKLGRFSRGETEDLLASIFEEEITPEFLDGIYGETEGNPFFIEEMCKALVEEGKLYFENGRWHRPDMEELDLPQSVRVAIQSRLAKLPDQVQDVLRIAAVLGHEFDFDTLSVTSELEEDALIEALETAERSQLVEELSGEHGGTFRFAHALIASTLVENLSGLRRRRMHGQAAEAIRSVRPDDYETLAHHFSESGDLKEGLTYSLKAGERAKDFWAHNEAHLHFTRALEMGEAQGLTDELIPILEAIGDVQIDRDLNQSVAAYRRAMELSTLPEKRAALKAKIGSINALTGDERGLPLLEVAIRELDPETQASELALAIASVGRFYHNRGQHRRAIEHLERAQQIAEPMEGAVSLRLTYAYLAGAYQHLADFQQSLEWARRNIHFGERSNDPTMTAGGHEYHAENFNFMGRWEEALKHVRIEQEIAAKAGLLDRGDWAGLSELWALHGLGRLAEAAEAGQRSLERAEATGDWRLAVLAGADLSLVYADRGELESAQTAAELAAKRAIDLDQVYMVCIGQDSLAYQHALRGEWQKALDCRMVTAEAAKGTDNRLVPMVNSPGFAEALMQTGRFDRAAEIAESGLKIARESGSPIPEARILRIQGRFHAAQGRPEAAAKTLSKAVKICEEWKSQLLLGQVLLDWGSIQAAQAGAEPAAARLQRALEIFEACGATLWVERTQTALGELATEGQGSSR